MLDFAWEFPRVLFEVGRLACSWELLVADNRRGSRCPVMVLPGFLGGDDSTLILRRFLTRLGYTTLPWLQGQNTGQMELLDGAIRRFYKAHQVYGEKIALVGQSLGGIYAREIAREFPDAVRCVVTLGSPFAADDDGAAIPVVQELFE